jgi:hypothetical protein
MELAMTRASFLALLLVFSTAQLVQAQNNPPVHQHAPANLIDGAVHPELVPDLVAYRLVLLAMSKPPNLTDQQSKRQAAQLSKINLREPDQKELASVLANFCSEYHNLIQTYNEAATAANARGERSDISYLLLERDQLVQSTHDKLKNSISTDSWARFDAYVQHEKSHMKVSLGDVK